MFITYHLSAEYLGPWQQMVSKGLVLHEDKHVSAGIVMSTWYYTSVSYNGHGLEAIGFLIQSTASLLLTLGSGSDALKGQSRRSSQAPRSHLTHKKHLERAHLSWTLPCPREAGVNRDERLRRAATTAPSPRLDPCPDERGVQRLGAGITLGQHETAESHQI